MDDVLCVGTEEIKAKSRPILIKPLYSYIVQNGPRMPLVLPRWHVFFFCFYRSYNAINQFAVSDNYENFRGKLTTAVALKTFLCFSWKPDDTIKTFLYQFWTRLPSPVYGYEAWAMGLPPVPIHRHYHRRRAFRPVKRLKRLLIETLFGCGENYFCRNSNANYIILLKRIDLLR